MSPRRSEDFEAVTARIPKDLHDRLVALGRSEDRTMSSLIRVALCEYVERRAPSHPAPNDANATRATRPYLPKETS